MKEPHNLIYLGIYFSVIYRIYSRIRISILFNYYVMQMLCVIPQR